jgi:hypothetical protein
VTWLRWHRHRSAAPAARGVSLLGLLAVLAGCGQSAAQAPPSSGVNLMVQPTNSVLLTGVDRIGLALLDGSGRPVSGAHAVLRVTGAGGVDEHRPLENIGPEYGGIPVYTGTAGFPQVGVYDLAVAVDLGGGRSGSGRVAVRVSNTGPELPVGAHAPAVRQAILGDPGVTIDRIDSGVPPDAWHTTTVAGGLAQHRPMVLYFGAPGFCTTRTCGPTVQVLQQLSQRYGDRLLIEHIETRSPPGLTGPANPAFDAFGLQTDPWVYFVNSGGVVADRFEGPVTLDELASAADGTLAGRVPAVQVSLNG